MAKTRGERLFDGTPGMPAIAAASRTIATLRNGGDPLSTTSMRISLNIVLARSLGVSTVEAQRARQMNRQDIGASVSHN